MALRDDLLAFAPEFPDNARVDLMLTYAALRVNRRVWGSRADFGTILLACHMLKRLGPIAGDPSVGAAVGGVVTLEKVGDIQTQYAAIEIKGDEELVTSTYGAMFAELKSKLGVSPIMTGSDDAAAYLNDTDLDDDGD